MCVAWESVHITKASGSCDTRVVRDCARQAVLSDQSTAKQGICLNVAATATSQSLICELRTAGALDACLAAISSAS